MGLSLVVLRPVCESWFFEFYILDTAVLCGNLFVLVLHSCMTTSVLKNIVVSAYRYIAITTLAIIAVSLKYLRQFLIDLHQTYRHSSVP